MLQPTRPSDEALLNVTAEKKQSPDRIVIHYHEVALKRGNRALFERQLVENIKKATRGLGVKRVETQRGRIILSWDTLAAGVTPQALLDALRPVFGIANFALAWRCSTEPAQMETEILQRIEGRGFTSFRISARRANKTYPLTSVEINERLGRAVRAQTGARVDLCHPEQTIHLELSEREAFIYFEKFRGVGGLPVGVSGPVGVLLSGGIDSPVASYLMMKRGCRATFIHFHSYPLVSKSSWEKAEALVSHLTRYQFRSRLYLVPFGDIQRQIVSHAAPPLRVVLYRRSMLRIAEKLAQTEQAKALVTGDSLGQVASQTLPNLTITEEATSMPVLRPLIGYDKEEIILKAREIGTYEISIEPDEDCCRLFVPPHPSIGAQIEKVHQAESELDIADLVQASVEAATVQTFQA